MSKKLVLLIDGENLLHQSFHKFENLKSTNGKPSGAIFGFFKSLHMYLTRFAPDLVYIAFDNGHSPVRTKLLKSYKEHRKNISIDYESLQSQKREIMKMLGMLSIPYIFDRKKITKYEGDDFLAYLAINIFKESKIILVSSDKDFNQLITKNLSIYNPRKDERVMVENCKALFGYHSHETVDYLSMVGDTSDDIPGMKGIGPVKARKILDEGPLHEYTKDKPELEKIRVKNNMLINLFWFVRHVKLERLPVKKRKWNYNRFKEKAIEYSLASFLTNQFIKPFKELQQ